MKLLFLPRTKLVMAGLITGTLSSMALAHAGPGVHDHAGAALSSFAQGAGHPLTGMDHLAAMVAVGVWSALSSSRSRSLLAAPAAFAGLLLVGALLAFSGMRLPGIEPMIAASLLVLGLLVASRAALPAPVAAALVGGFALFHGLAHGQELGGHPFASMAGMVLSTVVLHAAGIALGLALRRRHAWLPRAAGAGVAAFGMGLLVPAAVAAF